MINREDETRILGHIRRVVRFTWLDWVLLLVAVACVPVIYLSGTRQWAFEPALFSFWAAVAFVGIVLNIVNRLIGEFARLIQRVERLEQWMERMLETEEHKDPERPLWRT